MLISNVYDPALSIQCETTSPETFCEGTMSNNEHPKKIDELSQAELAILIAARWAADSASAALIDAADHAIEMAWERQSQPQANDDIEADIQRWLYMALEETAL